ncbi:MAG TPA: hypothetical protein VFQ43_19180 [Nitrososphaera sp.]|nr:hypothetical protein [Nitrososphaera sp.]
MELIEFRRLILQSLVQVGTDEYKENVRILGVLDDKAQKTGAIAGAFLAAGLAFIKPENFGTAAPLSQLAGSPGLLLLGLGIGLLLMSTVLALRVMWVRSAPTPPRLVELAKMADHLLELSPDELVQERQENYFRDQARTWESVLSEQDRLSDIKASNLRLAQLTLVSAIVLLALILLEIVAKVACYRLHG